MTQFEELQQTSLAEQVFLQVREAYLDGSFLPGQRVAIRPLAEEFGVSTMPVREALHRLVAEGALVFENRRSICVPVLKDEDIQDICGTRRLLEGEAAARAALRATTSDISHIKALDAHLWAQIEAGSFKELAKANRDFHFAIYEIGGSPSIVRCASALWLKCAPYLVAEDQRRDETGALAKNYRLHKDLIHALEAHDAERARDLLGKDIENAAAGYLRSPSRNATLSHDDSA